MKTTIFFLAISISGLFGQDSTRFFNNPVAAISSTIPDAFGRGYLGNIGLGGNAQNTTRLNDDKWGPDANAIFTLGLGNPEKYIGLDVRLNIYGISNSAGQKGNLGEGTLDWHISRMVTRRFWAGVGGYDLLGLNPSEPNSLHSVYVCATTFFPLKKDNLRPFSTIWLNGGLGNGRFRADKNFTLKKTGPAGVFASAALQVLPTANLIVEWSGYGLYSGLSIVPFKKWPLQIVLGADDLLHHQWRFVVSGSVGFRLIKKREVERFRPYFLPVVPPPQSSRV